ncbi:MAG: type II toxin-antitoxin system HicA family toxin [Candidatus Bipolaricaulota bacterium]|nr:type II toxin-antitoxin system HicA family toxin [Candidatus Bipolaricaulota bacterium]
MPKLRPEKPATLVRKLRRLGFEGPFGGGRHPVMRHPRTGQKIPVPMHKGRDLPLGTLRTILRAVGISIEEWNKL